MILVVGATGQLGTAITRKLVTQKLRVRVFGGQIAAELFPRIIKTAPNE